MTKPKKKCFAEMRQALQNQESVIKEINRIEAEANDGHLKNKVITVEYYINALKRIRNVLVNGCHPKQEIKHDKT